MPSSVLTHELALSFLELPEIRANFYFCGDVDSFYEYINGCFQLVDKRIFEKQLLTHILRVAPTKSITPALIEQVTELIKMLVVNKIESMMTPFIALTDCLYDFENFEFCPFDKTKPAFLTFPFSRQQVEETKTPDFDNYLKTTFVDSEARHLPDLLPFVQEMLGYYLIPNALGTVMFFVGSGANGKSVLADVILKMIGKEHSSAMTITDLTMGRFSLPNLVGKFLNVCNEEESKYMRSDRFKALVTGEFITAEKKYGAHFQFRPHTKFLFCTNEMPTFDGMNFGLKRRVKILPFLRRFAVAERDLALPRKLEKELPGIFRFALDGAKRYQLKGRFTDNVKLLDDAMEELEKSSSSSIYYVKTFYEKSETEWIPSQDLYKAYRSWCEMNGKKPVNSILFGRDVGETFSIHNATKRIEGVISKAWPLKNKDDEVQSYVEPTELPW